MLTFWIIEKLDVIEDVCTSLLTGCIGFTPYAFSFEELEEALCHGIVVARLSAPSETSFPGAVPPSAHASFQVVCLKE
jgi:hypothetical protein